jgi:hypothetical protein
MRRQKIADMLRGADRRSIGRSNEVVQLVLRRPEHFPELIKCLWSEDPVLRLRAADAAEKASAVRPELMARYKLALLGLLSEAVQIELRWHLALMVPRLPLIAKERQRAAATLRRYLDDRSSIVKTFALQGLTDLARNDPGLRRQVRELLEESVRSGTAAMKARARKLLKVLQD